MPTNHNYQDIFLTQAQRRRAPVTVYLINGFQMRGVVAAFDSFVVLLEVEGRCQMIYKHAISTVAPLQPMEMTP